MQHRATKDTTRRSAKAVFLGRGFFSYGTADGRRWSLSLQNEALAKRLYEAEKDKWDARYASSKQAEAKAPEQDREDLTARLAEEFVELKSEFPDLAEFQQVPQTVVDMAVSKGITLIDAYLRYQHAEQKKLTAAKAAQEAAAKASPGSQAAGAGETNNPTIDAMMAGVWG